MTATYPLVRIGEEHDDDEPTVVTQLVEELRTKLRTSKDACERVSEAATIVRRKSSQPKIAKPQRGGGPK